MADDPKDKPLPVMKSALGPAAAEFGQVVKPLGKEAGEVTVRAVRVGLRAVSGLVWGFEQIGEFVQRSVAEKLKDVPPERIVEANPRVAVPAVEALRYTMQDSDVREMFSSLIATDLNSATKEQAHPSFVEIIKQMSTDDAKFLPLIKKHGGAILYQGRLHMTKESMNFNEMNLLLTVVIPGCTLDRGIKSVYSLARLGLVSLSETTFPAGDIVRIVEEYKESDEHKRFLKHFETIPDFRYSDKKIGIRLTPLGEDFARACF